MDYSQPLTTTILLEKMSDWTMWYEQFKNEAILLGVWNDLDPDSDIILEAPS